MSCVDRIRFLVAVGFLTVCLPVSAAGASDPSGKGVLATDLESGTRIIGLLGIPLGELASVDARIVRSDSKETDQYIEVLKVDNLELPKPIRLEFSVWQWGNLSGRPLPINRVLSLRVYETGGMVGVPLNAMKETVYVGTVDWGFSTSIVILYENQ